MSVLQQLESANQANVAYETAANDLNEKRQELLSSHNMEVIETYTDQAMEPLLELNKKHSTEFETVRSETAQRHKSLNTHGGMLGVFAVIVGLSLLFAYFMTGIWRIVGIGVAAVAVVAFILLTVFAIRKKRLYKRVTAHYDDFYKRVKADLMALPATDYLPPSDDEDESNKIYNTFEMAVLGMRSLNEELAKESRAKLASFVLMGATNLAKQDPRFNQLPSQDENTLANDKAALEQFDTKRQAIFAELKLPTSVSQHFNALYRLAQDGNYSTLETLSADFDTVMKAPKSADGVLVPQNADVKSNLIGYIRALQTYMQYPVLD